MISGYWTKLYARELRNWHAISFQAVTRSGRIATEWLWSNFSEPVALHDYHYLGTNFRERERIKRKMLRWTLRLKRMPTLERRAFASRPRADIAKSVDAAARSLPSPPMAMLATGSKTDDSGHRFAQLFAALQSITYKRQNYRPFETIRRARTQVARETFISLAISPQGTPCLRRLRM